MPAVHHIDAGDDAVPDTPTPELVATIRSRTGQTQEQLAHELGVSFATVNAWERGRSEPRRARRLELERMAAALASSADRPTRILVIDDDPVSRLVVEGMVAGAGRAVEVDAAAGGVEGLLKCGSQRPDLLFLDILMPDLDGLEVAQRVRGIEGLESTIVVLMTSSDDPRLLARAAQSGADRLLRKPLADQEVHELVDLALR